jgi:hypothetical protein
MRRNWRVVIVSTGKNSGSMEGAEMTTARWISRGAQPDSSSGAIAALGGAVCAVSAVLVTMERPARSAYDVGCPR